MAGWLEEMFQTGEYGFPEAFLKACPASAATNGLKAKAEELDRTWQPTGFYTWQQMADLVAAAVEMSGKASSMAIDAYQYGKNDILRKAAEEYNAIARRANEDYVPAWRAAKTANAPVNAPGFKRWIVDLLKAAHKLARVSEIAVCTAPWWHGILSTFMYYFNKVVDLAKSIAGVVVAAGVAVVNAVESAINLWPIVKWGGIAIGVIFGSVFLWNKLQFTAEEARKPVDWDAAFARWGRRARGAAGKARGLFPGGSLFRKSPPVAGRRLLR